ncbi:MULTISPECIES: ABC transporter permease [Paraburkholderia]|uniref:Binding-protein-dependent transport systems inner membrane component n=3 Tax=Paraburkholderia TaxID=1822464 RepID=B2JRL6_PARP8|nr:MULTISPECIES: ABC transporter permease [Paraburkholderia]ACC72343.1 binding-protein-dependent transport systems inner membrane component [Paraburkholderia phymatum STM815]AFT86237.1 NitT/TauT family transport system permease protein [Paraburkholderia phenoliruptrix BR3459a]CAB4048794.1 Riboflavin transport system permease protein RibX [Paraburkholderia phenoliruptrix]
MSTSIEHPASMDTSAETSSKKRSDKLLSITLLIVILATWEFGVRYFQISQLIVPTPSSTATSLIQGFSDGSLLSNLGVTFYETMVGFFAGAGLGLLLGGIIGQSALAEKILYPYVIAFQTVPKVAIAPLIVIWFGYGVTSKVVITATIAFFPVLANTIVGLRSAPRDQIDLIVAFTGSKWHIFRYVKVPNALPYIFVGLDVAIVLAVIGAIVGEFVGSQAGLGYLILQRNFSMDTAGVFAILLILSLMGIGLHWVMQAIKRKVVFWINHDADSVSGA